MIGIGNSCLQRVREYRRGFGETDPMFLEILRSFFRIPFEFHVSVYAVP